MPFYETESASDSRWEVEEAVFELVEEAPAKDAAAGSAAGGASQSHTAHEEPTTREAAPEDQMLVVSAAARTADPARSNEQAGSAYAAEPPAALPAPLVSIIIPVYNGQRTLSRAVRSALRQTYRTIEVIIVDDASTDSTSIVAQALSEADARVHVITHEENKARLEARKTGIAAAQGDYLLFLDADDELSPDCCTTLMAAAGSEFDIVHCGMDVRFSRPVDHAMQQATEAFCQPSTADAFGADVAHAVFAWRRGPWSLCAKLFRTAVVKRALSALPSGRITYAEDALAYFLVSYYAQSYRAMADYMGYVYHIDDGGSHVRDERLCLDGFNELCQCAQVIEALRSFLSCAPNAQDYESDFAMIEKIHVEGTLGRMFADMAPADVPAAWTHFMQAFGLERSLAALAKIGWEFPTRYIELINPRESMPAMQRPVKTVALCYFRMSTGGAEQITATLAKLWQKAGHKVVLFCDTTPQPGDYELPGVEVVVLPDSFAGQPDAYGARAEALLAGLRAHEVDAMVYEQWMHKVLPWDFLCCRALGIPVVSYFHGCVDTMLRFPHSHGFHLAKFYKHLDGTVILGPADAWLWRTAGARVWQAPNPCTLKPDDLDAATLAGEEIVWVGRLHLRDKQPDEALRIFAAVHARHPEAHLTLVGPPHERDSYTQLTALAEQLGVQNSVSFAGNQAQVAPYLQAGRVFLMTSRYEGYCLSLAEAKAAGLPCVMYALPYLMLAKEGTGVISVPQGDVAAAADAVCRVLEDGALARRMGTAARTQMLHIADFDFCAFWESVFSVLEGKSTAPTGTASPELASIAVDTILNAGCALSEEWEAETTKLRTLVDALAAERESLTTELAALRGSASFRAGRVLTAAPRRLRELFKGGGK